MHPVNAPLPPMPSTSDLVAQLKSHPLVPGVDHDIPLPPVHRLHEYDQLPPEKGPPAPNRRPSLAFMQKPGQHVRPLLSHAQKVLPPTDPTTQMNQAPAWSTSGVPPWSTQTRPLSDIRELTEPSLVELANRKPPPNPPASDVRRKCSLSRKGSLLSRKGSITRKPSLKAAPSPTTSQHAEPRRGRPSPVKTPATDRSSIYSIPSASVPPRSSSHNRENRAMSLPRGPSLPPPPPRGLGFTIPNRGQSRSPVRETAARFDPISSDVVQMVPPRTFARIPSNELLEFPTHRHPRVSADLQVGAPLFVGGGSLEGNVRITVDDAERTRHKRALAIARISIDLLGVEEMWNAKRDAFLNLATELIDSEIPPPHNMVESVKQISPLDPFWLLTPSVTTMPFSLSLPLDVGPPPFQSKLARIRYVLCVTLLIRDKGTQYLVRTSQDVSVLSVYDPEKALMSLPSPLTASDEFTRPREVGVEVVRITAGLHRQVWVSGTSIFVDVHIVNNSRKTIKRLDLQLERDILCYKHTAASTMEKSASQARIFDNNERTVLAKAAVKQGTHGWAGVEAHSTDTRTCDLELPRGHATVKCGKFFEVRYFLNIAVSSAHTKLVTVQLPIVLIHMNSLDVVPNSVAQVAAAIEEKRKPTDASRSRALTRRPSASVQGRAFVAPRIQSLDRMRAEADDLQQITNILERSPRRYKLATKHTPCTDGDDPNGLQKEHVLRRVQSAAPNITGASSDNNSPESVNVAGNDSINNGGVVGLGFSYDDNSSEKACAYDHPVYATPPNSNRKGRVMETASLENMRHHLRHVRSNETDRSHRTEHSVHMQAQQPALAPNPFFSFVPAFAPHPGISALEFREAEVGEDLDLLGGGNDMGGVQQQPGAAASAASFKARIDAARERQQRRFHHQHGHGHGLGHGFGHGHHRRRKSRDGGGGGGIIGGGMRVAGGALDWFIGDRGEREKEKEKERRRAMDNWI